MGERLCPGLPADWLNGWLAAIGSLVLVPELRLRWSDDPVPLAVLTAPGEDDPASLIAARWPTEEWVNELPIARHRSHAPELPLKPSVEAWTGRVSHARASQEGWTLTCLYTDLLWDTAARGQVITSGQFNRSVPKGLTLFERLRSLVRASEGSSVTETLEGSAARVMNNGLGFDLRRIASLADDTHKLVDPVMEVLAFMALALFPTRGDGRRRSQRLWTTKTGPGAFRWCSWERSLSASGIDALLDLAQPQKVVAGGLNGAWELVPAESRGTQDLTRGYGSRRVDGPWDRR